MCSSGCKVLKYLDESHLVGRVAGQCVSCGAIFHGYRCNWRAKFSPEHGFIILKRVAERGRAAKTRSSPARKPPRIDEDLVRELSEGGDLKRMIAELQKLGIRIR